jgi:hypothetical protein
MKPKSTDTGPTMPSNTPVSTLSAVRSPERNKKLVIVIGAESSGNRLIFKMLKEAGGYADDEERMSAWWGNPKSIQCDVDRITFRSLPHGGINNGRQFVDPVAFCEGALRAGYDVRFIVTTRDKNIVEKSKIRVHTLGDAILVEREMNTTREVLKRLIDAHGERCFLWSYETFMFLRDDYLRALYRWLGVGAVGFTELVDGNVKYLAR